jgi:hypothetical protein
MARYRKALPQLQGNLSLMDASIVTTLVFHESLHLPHFAAFDLLNTLARSKERENCNEERRQTYGAAPFPP